MVSFLISAAAFLGILAPLVVIHELGHFLFARLFNVKAEAFSIGFGPKLFARKWGETDFRLSLIPLGGYVKLLGEDRSQELSAADEKRALHHQAPWKRFLIFFGGPLFNFIGAVLIFMAVLAIGEKQLSSTVGRVVPGSLAEQMGFKSGDQILRVGQTATKLWEDVYTELASAPGKTIPVEVKRKEQVLSLAVTPSVTEGFSLYGEVKNVGEVDGLIAVPRSLLIGVDRPDAVSAKQGLRTGDRVTALRLNGQESVLSSWEHLEELTTNAAPSTRVMLQVVREGEESRWVDLGTVSASARSNLLEQWGLFPAELFVEQTVAGSAAAKTGLEKGDHLWAIDGERVHSFYQLRSMVQKKGEKNGKLDLTWIRGGQKFVRTIELNRTVGSDALLKKVTTFTIGVMPMAFQGEPIWTIERVWNPFVLLYKATAKVVILTYRNVMSIVKMLMGQVSTATLGGPIMIGKIAGEAIQSSISEFLTRMAFFSIGLGVLNLMPIPVLDGGHIVLLAIERIRRKPFTLKQLGIAQMVGLVLILSLMGKVFFNDFSRL